MKKTETTDNLRRLGEAILSPSLPTNPIPFALGIITGAKEYGTEWIRTDEAKAILLILMIQAYTSSVVDINLRGEWDRICKIYQNNVLVREMKTIRSKA